MPLHEQDSYLSCATEMAEQHAGGNHAPGQPGHINLEVEMLHGAAQVETPSQLPVGERGGQAAPIAVDFTEQRGRTAATAVVDVHLSPPVVDPLVGQIAKRLGELPVSPAGRPCICRVPPRIRQQESEAYEPMLVSIGPLHRGKKSLLPIEEVKLSYLHDLLGRSPVNNLDNYVSSIRECQHRARMQYAEEIELTEDEFVEMLVVDGCFIIEYFVKRIFKETAATVPLSSVRWGFAHLRRDLMLLENQIPFFVLVKLYENSKIPFSGSRKEPLTLMEITLRFLDIKLPMQEQPQADKVFHLLHLYHLCLDPGRVVEVPYRSCRHLVLYPLKQAANLSSLFFFGLLYLVLVRKLPRCFMPPKRSNAPRMIGCATELVEAGVQFKKKDPDEGGVNCLLKVSFSEGTLEIPFLKVEESTASKLRNLIALEQCCSHVGSHFTSYGIFMGNIINTESDVVILRSCGIIESKLGSDAEVAAMFNALCKGAHLKYDSHYNAPLFRAVKSYRDFAHRRWRATLVHKYSSNPWAIMSLLAGCLIALTATQTYFTVFPRR